MLQAAGIGVAMGNASDEVKKHANYVTEPIQNDGLAKALQHFQLIWIRMPDTENRKDPENSTKKK